MSSLAPIAALELLVITTLYPNAEQQRHGIFVETRLKHLLAAGGFSATVIAPIPWFPFPLKWAPEYSRYARVPREERRDGLRVLHPRYLIIPKIGMLLTPLFLAMSVFLEVRRLRAKGYDFDVVDGHYYYPDGVALAWLRRYFSRPLTITARGTDINLVPRFRIPREMIRRAAATAEASITVCQALKTEMVELGCEASKIHVLRNGVDLELFHVAQRESLREKLAITGPTLISVGHLIERKGHHYVVDALLSLPDHQLIVVGDGEEEQNLRRQVEVLDLGSRVRFVGALTQTELCEYYNAADIMVLASSREGWANVLLESMACGTPVVATNIWGTPEVVSIPEVGELVTERSGKAIAAGVQTLESRQPDRDTVRAYAERFSWGDTVDRLSALFRSLSDMQGRVDSSHGSMAK